MLSDYDPDQWWGWNECVGVGEEAYHNAISVMKARDIVCWRRDTELRYKLRSSSDDEVLNEFVALYWAWKVDRPSWTLDLYADE